MIWATVSSRSCFCWLYRASPFLAAKNIINLISVLTIWWCPCVESSLVSFTEPIFAWNVPLVSLIFLKRSLVFPILLFSSISLHWSLRKAFLSLLAIFWNSAFRCLYLSFSPLLFTSLLFIAICEASQTAILLFCISFPWGLSWSLSPVQCHKPHSIVHQALYQI